MPPVADSEYVTIAQPMPLHSEFAVTEMSDGCVTTGRVLSSRTASPEPAQTRIATATTASTDNLTRALIRSGCTPRRREMQRPAIYSAVKRISL